MKKLFYSGVLVAGLALVTVGAMASPGEQIEPFSDTACLNCHSNEATLRELALPAEEPKESLSSGPG